MGEFVVTDNPQNVIPQEKWKPVANVVETPVTGVRLGEGLFRKVMENNIAYLMNSFSLDELVYDFRLKAGMPLPPRSGQHSAAAAGDGGAGGADGVMCGKDGGRR